MSIALAATWNPRGELDRLERLLPQMQAVYDPIIIVFPPVADIRQVEEFDARGLAKQANIEAVRSSRWPSGRITALSRAAEVEADFVQYADMDRLVRWVETRPEEWRRTVDAICTVDCTLIGRTAAAIATHPRALVESEAVSNRTISYLIGQKEVLDVSAGSKGFSRAAAGFIAQHAGRDRALGADGEWLVLACRAGFSFQYLEVDGLDWETADRYRSNAADADNQRMAAAEYDADPRNWSMRIQVAEEIVAAGVDAARREIKFLEDHQKEK